MSTVKRVFFYTVSLVTLVMFAAGAGILLSLCFGLIAGSATTAQVGVAGSAREQLSLGLAMLVIGGGLWLAFWRIIQRHASGNPAETGSAIRKLFLNLVLLVAALNCLQAAVEFLVWLMEGVPVAQFPSGELATAIVTGAVWYYHWWAGEKEGHPSPEAKTLRRWYVYILSAWGLVSLCIGLIALINAAVFHLPVWGADVAQGGFWSGDVHYSLGWIIVGGPVWYFHWFRIARGDSDSTLRQVYLYLLAILGGAIAGLVALTTSLFKIFSFIFGSSSAAGDGYFQFLGWTVPTILVAAAVWTYHQQLVKEEAAQLQERLLSARRVHFYLMSFIGLGTLVSGLIILIGILLELLTNAVSSQTVVTSPGWWQEQLSICLALIVVAVPIWLYYWKSVLQMTAAGDVPERGARSRRIFLYVVLGTAVIALAADLVNIVYQLLNGLIQGTFGVNVLRESKWSLQNLFIAIPVLLYHWRLLRQDQRLGAEITQQRKVVTLLAGEAAEELAARIEERIGTRLRRLSYQGETPEDTPVLSDEELEKLANDIKTAPGDKVMLVATEGRVIVLPYRDK